MLDPDSTKQTYASKRQDTSYSKALWSDDTTGLSTPHIHLSANPVVSPYQHLELKVSRRVQRIDGRGRDDLREGISTSGLQDVSTGSQEARLANKIGPSLGDQPRLRPVTRSVAKCARAGHVTARHFCDWLGRYARHSRGRLRMPRSREASEKRGDEEGLNRGRSSGTQLSSISHLDRSDDQDVDAQRACCHRGELGGKGVNRGCGSAEAFMCHCGFSAAARPSRGIRWAGLCGAVWKGTEGAKRCTNERS
ncbi:hypothetical protein V494_05258, partial [Pseudogymnoascus sp. VKM F-4513 (FW-928)]